MNTSRKGQRNERLVRNLYEACGWATELMRMSKGSGGYDFVAETPDVLLMQSWRREQDVNVRACVFDKRAGVFRDYVQVKSNAIGDARRKFQAAWAKGKNRDGLCVIAVVYDGCGRKPKTVKWGVWRAEA
jgi:hypothetical protein